MPPRLRLGPLRERNLALLVSATSVSTLGSGMAQVALAFAVLEIGTVTQLGIVLLAREIPMVVFLLLGGVWADRVSRKRLIVAGDLIRGATQAAAAALLLTGNASVWSLALLQTAFGVAASFTRPAHTGLVPQAVAAERLQEANALLNLSRSTLFIVGPAAGAAIVVAGNPGTALAVDSATFAVSALLLGALRLRPAGSRTAARSILGDIRDGWSEFTARTWVWAMVAGFGFFQLSLFPALLVLGPDVAKRELGGAGAWGAILAAQSAGAVVGGVLSLRVRPGRPLFAATVLTLPTAALLALLGMAAPVWLLCAVGVVASATLGITDVLWFTVLQQRIPEHAISRISSFDWLGSVALNPLGYALIGPLAGAVGTAQALYAAAALNASVSVCVALVPGVREVRWGEAAELPTPIAV